MQTCRRRKLAFSLLSSCLIGLGATGSLIAQNSDAQNLLLNPSPTLKMNARYHVEQGTDKGFLIVKFEIPAGNHIYSLTQKSPLISSKLTVKKNKLFSAGKKFKSDKKPKITPNDPLFNAQVEEHSGVVQFFVPIQVNSSADLKKLKPEIQFSGQMCSDEGFCKQINNKSVRAEFGGYFQREANAKLPAEIKK